MSASRWRDERGLTLPIIALIIGTLDPHGQLRRRPRTAAQRPPPRPGRADVVALDMMRVVEGRTYDELIADQTNVYAALTASADAQRVHQRPSASSAPPIPTRRGSPGSSGAPSATLQTATPSTPFGTGDDADVVPNAVRIRAERTTDYFFQPGEGTVTRYAVASHRHRRPSPASRSGSFGASLDSARTPACSTRSSRRCSGARSGSTRSSYQGLAAAIHRCRGPGGRARDPRRPTTSSPKRSPTTSVLLARRHGPASSGEGDIANAQLLRDAAAADAAGTGPGDVGRLRLLRSPVPRAGRSASQVNVLDLVSAPVFLAQCTDPIDPGTCSGLSVPLRRPSTPASSTSAAPCASSRARAALRGTVGDRHVDEPDPDRPRRSA